jgi:hypothetical protein
MVRWFPAGFGTLFVAALCGCGGGGGSSAAPQPVPSPGSTAAVNVPSPGPARSYAGIRTVTVTGSPVPGLVGPGTYQVVETDQDLPASGPGTVAGEVDRRAQRTFSATAPPPFGILPQSETRDDFVAPASGGFAVLSTTLTAVGRDIDDESHVPPGTQFTITTNFSESYPAGAIVVPATPSATTLPFPLGGTSALTQRSVETAGTFVGAIGRSIQYNRTTNADGSFDETGTFSEVGAHAIHQHADGSATSHDQLPGFLLRDVAVSPPSATLTVTTQTQGRTVGSPPVVTNTYTTPVWYGPGPLATGSLTVTPHTPTPSDCGFGSPIDTTHLALRRMHVDVPTGTRVTDTDDAYVDSTGLLVCRDTTETTSTFDVTTGAATGTTTDTTSVHYVSTAPSSHARKAM